VALLGSITHHMHSSFHRAGMPILSSCTAGSCACGLTHLCYVCPDVQLVHALVTSLICAAVCPEKQSKKHQSCFSQKLGCAPSCFIRAINLSSNLWTEGHLQINPLHHLQHTAAADSSQTVGSLATFCKGALAGQPCRECACSARLLARMVKQHLPHAVRFQHSFAYIPPEQHARRG